MKIFDNITDIVRDDLKETIQRGSKVSIAAACFSMYAYKELKNQLERVEEFRFIFTSPTFVQERGEKQRREFYIPRLSRETSLYGTEFEIKLRNEIDKEYPTISCFYWSMRANIRRGRHTRRRLAAGQTLSRWGLTTTPIGWRETHCR